MNQKALEVSLLLVIYFLIYLVQTATSIYQLIFPRPIPVDDSSGFQILYPEYWVVTVVYICYATLLGIYLWITDRGLKLNYGWFTKLVLVLSIPVSLLIFTWLVPYLRIAFNFDNPPSVHLDSIFILIIFYTLQFKLVLTRGQFIRSKSSG